MSAMAPPSLTRGQLQALKMLAAGYRHTEIAAELNVGRRSLWEQIERARQRLGVRTDAELVGRALALGILSANEVLRSQKRRRQTA